MPHRVHSVQEISRNICENMSKQATTNMVDTAALKKERREKSALTYIRTILLWKFHLGIKSITCKEATNPWVILSHTHVSHFLWFINCFQPRQSNREWIYFLIRNAPKYIKNVFQDTEPHMMKDGDPPKKSEVKTTIAPLDTWRNFPGRPP